MKTPTILLLLAAGVATAADPCHHTKATLQGSQKIGGMAMDVTLQLTRISTGPGYDGTWSLDDVNIDTQFPSNLPLGDKGIARGVLTPGAPSGKKPSEGHSKGGSHVGGAGDLTMGGTANPHVQIKNGRFDESSINFLAGGHIKGDRMILPKFTLGAGNFKVSGPIAGACGTLDFKVVSTVANPTAQERKRILVRAIAKPAAKVTDLDFDTAWAKGTSITATEIDAGLPAGMKDLAIDFLSPGATNFTPSELRHQTITATAVFGKCSVKRSMSIENLVLVGDTALQKK